MQQPLHLHDADPPHHQAIHASVDPDSEAMPPPQHPPDSQESQTSHASSASLPSTTFPSNAYAPRSDNIEYSPPSSFTPLQPSQHSSPPPSQSVDPARPDVGTEWRTKPNESGASSPSSGNSGSPTHGSKRTASGAIKTSDPASFPAAVKPRVATSFHSRNTSVASNASSVSELSAQLKTRLTYAMVKVQNGWENNSIAEVETLASQLSSPVFTSAAPFAMHSPRASLANANRRSRELTHAVSYQPAFSSARPGTSHSTQSTQSRPPTSLTEPYEPRPQSNGTPSLAPAPELKIATRDRRTNGFREVPPTLTKIRSSQSSAFAHPPRTPATPTPQEQDAVDTLLFMSSPANSAHFPHHRPGASSSMSSPRRTGFPAHSSSMPHAGVNGAAVPLSTLSNELNGGGGGGGGGQAVDYRTTHPAAKRRSLGVAFKTEREVDRLLDEMAEAAQSSDDEDVELSGRPASASSSSAATASRQLPHTNGMPVNVVRV